MRENEEVDLSKFFKFLLDKKKLIAKYALSFFLFGVVLSLVLPIKYESEIVLLAEKKESGLNASGILGGLSGLAGLEELTGPQDEIPTILYPYLVQSYSFLTNILEAKVRDSPDAELAPLREYLDKENDGSILSVIKKYTIDLPKLFSSNVELGSGLGNDFKVISEDEKELLENLKSSTEIEVDNTGLITITVELKDRWLAAAVVGEIESELTNYITEYNTQKARTNLDFVATRYAEQKTYYESLEEELAEFNDKNKNVILASAQSERKRLERELNIAGQLYISLATRLEQAKLELLEQTPVFTIVEPALVPLNKSKPKRKLIASLFLALGLMAVFIRLLVVYNS